jgi:DNA polymerase I-like protein with 3'-5' exonuclease and polymerase domains
MSDDIWTPPTDFPDLRHESKIAVDLETYDPRLEEDGPGGVRGDGYVVGVSLGTPGGFSGYFPVRHEGGDNIKNIAQFKRWLKKQLAYPMPKVGANIIYDLEWLKTDPAFGFDVAGPKLDVQIAEPLLNENLRSYRLGALGKRHLGLGKDEDLMAQKAIELFDLKAKTPEALEKLVKKNIWRLPARYVGPYATRDATLPLEIFAKQEELLRRDELWDLFIDTETPLVDLLLLMRLQGIPVDIERAEVAAQKLEKLLAAVRRKLHRRVGFDPDIWSAQDVERGCEKLGVKPPVTEKGNPSFEADYLEQSDCEFLNLVGKARKLDRGGSVFIRSKIINLAVNGRVHPQFWQVKTDGHGTGSGRFASSNPNIQQVPARDPEISPLVRSCFIPPAGKRWAVFDHSQQEPRVLIHYAYLCKFPMAAEARQKYLDNPATDYHQMTADMAGIERKPAKTINLGLSYGMGIKKLALSLGRSFEEAKALSRQYHAALPYVQALNYRCQDLAKARGYIKTILGRRRHFDLYGPTQWEKGIVPLPKDEALKKFGPPVTLYFLHKVMNGLIQGTSADMIKKNMLECWRQHGFVPLLTMHDENDYAVESDEDIKKIQHVMLTSVPLEVPLKVDIEVGPSWGEVVEYKI